MYQELLKSPTLDIFYQNINNLWGGLDYVGISDEHLSFRYIDNICIIDKEQGSIDINQINEPFFIKNKYLKSEYVKSFFKQRNFILEINKINWFDNYTVQETLINANNNILIDLSDFIKMHGVWGLSEFRYNSILLLNKTINKHELMKKIYFYYIKNS